MGIKVFEMEHIIVLFRIFISRQVNTNRFLIWLAVGKMGSPSSLIYSYFLIPIFLIEFLK